MSAIKRAPATTARPPWATNLTEREQAFVREYLMDFNGTQAMLRVDPKLTVDSAGVIASNMRAKPHIAFAIDQAMQIDSSGPRQWLLTKLRAIVDADISSLIEWDAKGKLILQPSKKLPKELSSLVKKIVRTKDGEMRIELHDPLKAIEQMAKIAALHQRPQLGDSEGDVLERLIHAAMELKLKQRGSE